MKLSRKWVALKNNGVVASSDKFDNLVKILKKRKLLDKVIVTKQSNFIRVLKTISQMKKDVAYLKSKVF